MAVAVGMAPPIMVWRSLGIEKMADSIPWGFGDGSSRPWLRSQDKQSNSERAMADKRAMTADESTATLECHVSMTCSGTRNNSVATRSVLAGGGAVAFSVRTGKCMVPRTPLWSKKEVERVTMSPIRSERCRGSQMVR
jgi:hypothetical protein